MTIQRGLFDDPPPPPTPAELRARHPGMLLLMRLPADHYAWMEEDQDVVQRLGVPLRFHQAELERVLRHVLRAGHRVAICDSPESEPREPIT
jgi:hypothetical protein